MSTTDPARTVAVIGLGNMGAPIAERLAGAGYAVRGYDLSQAARDHLAAVAGADAAPTPEDAVADADVAILMVPSSQVVEAILRSPAMSERLRPGTLVIDMSSSDPLSTQTLAGELAARGLRLIDAPVSGGVRGAQTGGLTIMVGGPEADVEEARALLSVLGKSVLHVGAVGAGHAMKALNNLLSACSLMATSEAIAVGERFGLDPHRMIEVLNGSSGRSFSTERKFPDMVLPGSFDSGFALRLMAKDVGIAVSLADRLGVDTPLGANADALWQQAASELDADADHTRIAEWVARSERDG